MNRNRAIVWLFAVAAVYDGLLGLIFLLLPGLPFAVAGLEPPNHPGYVRFPAALLVIFGVMFAAIAAKPLANRNLIPYGVMLKVAYCGIVFYYWFAQGLPWLWKPFAIADVVFAVLFLWACLELRPRAVPPGASPK